MSSFGVKVLEGHELIRVMNWTSKFRCTLKSEDEKIEYKAVVLENERSELESSDETVRVRVRHVFVAYNYVTFGRHIIGKVVVDYQSEKSVE
jgi:hypothetical protein